MSIVKDKSLADQGRKSIEYAEGQMQILLEIREKFEKEKPFQDITIGLALHVTKETAALVRTLKAGGANVALASCNPLSTQDEVAAALAEETNINVYAKRGESESEYYQYLNKVIDHGPDITIDDGCDLVTEIHKNHKDKLNSIIGGCEETTTGVNRLRSMEEDNALKYPVIAVNDNKTKHLLDNYYGTGQSSIDGIIRATNILFAGKNFVVSGYGDCGKGAAKRADGMGANVIVTEVDAFRALQAKLDGYRVMPMKKASKIGDIFLTVTGNKHVIRKEHIKKMKDGAILANAGHFNIEIDKEGLEKIADKKEKIRESLEKYEMDGKKVYLCGEGRLVNLASAEGHPSEVMATSFAGQSLACKYLVENQSLEDRVIRLPKEIDDKIAELQLKAWGVEKDSLTEEQKIYLRGWEEGT